jgi:hypothetical protein
LVEAARKRWSEGIYAQRVRYSVTRARKRRAMRAFPGENNDEV